MDDEGRGDGQRSSRRGIVGFASELSFVIFGSGQNTDLGRAHLKRVGLLRFNFDLVAEPLEVGGRVTPPRNATQALLLPYLDAHPLAVPVNLGRLRGSLGKKKKRLSIVFLFWKNDERKRTNFEKEKEN